VSTRPDWDAADQAYLAHHFACPTCIAAGITRTQPRCTEGQALWNTYQQAGTPPHFTWLTRKKEPRDQRQAPYQRNVHTR
jgi:hypothetical protein